MPSIESAQTIGDYFALLRRRKIYLLTILPAAVLLSVCLAYGLPAVYRAAATILIEQPAVSQKMVATTVGPTTTVLNIAPDAQIELMRRRALSHDQLKALVTRIDPYPDKHELSIGEKAQLVFDNTSLEKVDPITYKPLLEGAAFSIYYDNPNPLLASTVATELSKIFLDFNHTTRTEAAEQTYKFLLGRSKEIEAAMRNADQKIADFKKHYGAALPEDQLRNQSSLIRAQSELDEVQARIRLAEQRESQLSLQLSQLSPTMVGAVLDTRTDLATLKAQLADAELRYKPDHPDVKRLRRALQELLATHTTTMAPGVQPDNPEYLLAASALQSARQDLAALRGIAGRSQGERQTLEMQLAIAPSVEKEYAQLVRNLGVLQDQFQQVQGKLQEAEIGRSYETEQQGERFTLIRRPSVPDSAFSPNRLGLILIGFVLGGALAVGFAVFAESSDPTVRSYLDVREATDVLMLGAVPELLNAGDRRKRRDMVMAGVAALTVATVVAGLTIWRADRLANATTVAAGLAGAAK